MTLDSLVCPSCKVSLTTQKDRLTCAKCARRFAVHEGIPKMTDGDDAFYEGKFAEGIADGKGVKDRLRHLILRRLRFLKSVLQATHAKQGPLRILDLGCGGGHQMLARYGEVTGVDISFASLQSCRRYYDLVVAAEASKLPFADGSFDVVVAMDFFGHIPAESKSAILQEIERVLRPGGRTVQYIETQGNNSMQRLARQSPRLYEKYFIAPQGHVGLEAPRTVLERFYSNGLVPVRHEGAYKSWVKPPSEISLRFGGEYLRIHPWLRIPVAFDRLVTRFSFSRLLGTGLSDVVSAQVDRLLPTEMADGLFVEAVKK